MLMKINCLSQKNHYQIKNLSKEGGSWLVEPKLENKHYKEKGKKNRLRNKESKTKESKSKNKFNFSRKSSSNNNINNLLEKNMNNNNGIKNKSN